MANTHNVTVFIWRNSLANDTAADRGEKLVGNCDKTGHAAMKLQSIGAAKGDYHYLSFYPGYHPLQSLAKFNSMPGRMGPKSLAAANTTLEADWRHAMSRNMNLMTTKKFPTSLDHAGDFSKLLVEGQQHPALGGDDTTLIARKPDIKYRMNGPDRMAMINYVRRITSYEGADAAHGVAFDIRDFNCATAVANCLEAGGAANKPQRKVWSPNRLAEWCETLIQIYGGIKIDPDDDDED